MKRIVCLALLLSGCVHERVVYTWERADGKQVAPQQLQVDKSICDGDAAKAKLSSPVIRSGPTLVTEHADSFDQLNADIGAEIDRVVAERKRDEQGEIVVKGCMAQRGYLSVAHKVQ